MEKQLEKGESLVHIDIQICNSVPELDPSELDC